MYTPCYRYRGYRNIYTTLLFRQGVQYQIQHPSIDIGSTGSSIFISLSKDIFQLHHLECSVLVADVLMSSIATPLIPSLCNIDPFIYRVSTKQRRKYTSTIKPTTGGPLKKLSSSELSWRIYQVLRQILDRPILDKINLRQYKSQTSGQFLETRT